MPRRTAEATKAVQLAWQREYELIQEGKGTRDWTEEQQRDILNPEKGRAYDDNGRAFNGQHMKSVEKYPEYQGDPDNIQFLTRKEHLEAHQGNWKNPTNWYYDPVTKQFFNFGEENIVPCPVIELSKPIIICTYPIDNDLEVASFDVSESEKVTEEQRTPSSKTRSNSIAKATAVKPKSTSEDIGFFKRFICGTTRKLKRAGTFITEHKEIIIGIATTAATAVGSTVLKEKIRNGNSTGGQLNNEVSFDDNDSNLNDEENAEDIDCLESLSDYIDMENKSAKGAAKSPHPRRGYFGDRWKKDENGELKRCKTWISETYVNKDKIDENVEQNTPNGGVENQ